MGCIFSKWISRKYEVPERIADGAKSSRNRLENKKEEKSNNPSLAPESVTPPVRSEPTPKPKLDPKDFQFRKIKGETRVKTPGSIQGQAFIIDTCEDCDLYILDHCACVNIDDCKNCRIFIGPTDSSIFLRDSQNVTCALISRQVRLRDVTNCKLALLCRTKPIIESSTNIQLSCLDLSYPALTDQLRAIKMDPLHNFWSCVHDYTPAAGNWRLLPAETTTVQLLRPVPKEALEAMGEVRADQAPVWRTLGDQLPPAGSSSLLLLWPQPEQQAVHELIQEAKKRQLLLRSTNRAQLSPPLAEQVAEIAGWAGEAKRRVLGQGECVCMEWWGAEGAVEAVEEMAAARGALCTTEEGAGAALRCLGIDG